MSDEYFGQRTYAQHGDDIVLACLFEQLGATTPSYLDLGAFHPIKLSNTALFYERGSRGVNVEPNPARIGDFRKWRPKDINVECAVGLSYGRQKLHRYGNIGYETLSPEWGMGWKDYRDSRHSGEVEVEVMTVAQILGEFCDGRFPDLLSIDIEGLDFAVLKSMDFETSRPMVIDVEAHRGDPESLEIKDYLESAGFYFVMRCVNNCIFMDEMLRRAASF